MAGTYPSVLGFDVGRLEVGASQNIDDVDFDHMRRWIRQGHGGSHHELLREYLDRFAEFAGGLVDSAGRPIPIVFRPYHEHSGDWFWWGVDNHLNPVDDFVALCRFTVEYLRGDRDCTTCLGDLAGPVAYGHRPPRRGIPG